MERVAQAVPRFARPATLLVVALVLCPRPAEAVDVTGSIQILNRFNVQRNFVQTQILYDRSAGRFLIEDYLSPKVDTLSSTHAVGGMLDADLGKGWSFTASADSGMLRVGSQNVSQIVPVGDLQLPLAFATTETEVRLTSNGLPVTDELRRSLFLREAFFTHESDSWLRLFFGKKRMVLLSGFLYDQYTFGAGLRLEGKPSEAGARWRLDLEVLLADGSFDTGGKTSPLVHLGVYHVPGPFQYIGLDVVYFHDGDNLFSEVLRSSIIEGGVGRAQEAGIEVRPEHFPLVPISSGDVVWAGIIGKRFFGNHTLSGALYGQLGRVNATVVFLTTQGMGMGGRAIRRLEMRALGIFGDLAYQYDFTEDLVAGGFLTFLSGDDELLRNLRSGSAANPTLDSFLSVFPFVGRSNLFFNGGLNGEFTLRRASTLGVNGRGVIAGGTYLRWDPDGLRLTGRVVVLASQSPSLYDGRFYGTEVDLNLNVSLGRYLSLVAEVDTLLPGSFFATRSPIFQAIVGIDVRLP